MNNELLKPCPYCGNTQIDYYNVPYASFFGCSSCGLCGPRELYKNNAADAWNVLPRHEKQDLYQPLYFHPALPRRLRWTREKPTEEGWYWLKEEGRHAVVKMTAGGMISEPYVRHANEVDGEWAGPIPEPEEP